MSGYQVMPALTAEEYEALRADIAERGVLTPVVKDQHGNILDGHHRVQIAEELGLHYRVDTVVVLGEDEAWDLALMYNLARRHLTREQKRQLVAQEIERRPADTDRAIARRLRCSPSTVGAVRREVSKLDTQQKELSDEERQRFNEVEESILSSLHEADKLIVSALLQGLPAANIVAQLVKLQREAEKASNDREFTDIISEVMIEPRIDDLLAWPGSGFYAEEGRAILALMPQDPDQGPAPVASPGSPTTWRRSAAGDRLGEPAREVGLGARSPARSLGPVHCGGQAHQREHHGRECEQAEMAQVVDQQPGQPDEKEPDHEDERHARGGGDRHDVSEHAGATNPQDMHSGSVAPR